jgi:hypothetical protein
VKNYINLQRIKILFLNINKSGQRLIVFVGFLFSLLLLGACDSGILSKSKEEGVMEFDSKGVDPAHPLYSFAPSSATLKFKGEKFAIEMSIMGMFNTTILADNKKKTVAQTVKFLDIKQACVEKGPELNAENDKYALKIEETSETKEILGFKCHRLKVSKRDNPNDHFDAWYTTELGTEDINSLTPYNKVKGMLMDYRIERMGMELHFVAKSFNKVEVPDKTFDIPASMKIVSRPEMEKFIEGLQ